MFDKREKGTYIETFKKEVNNIVYTKTETTMINDKNKIINFTKEYFPAIKIGLENDNWEKS